MVECSNNNLSGSEKCNIKCKSHIRQNKKSGKRFEIMSWNMSYNYLIMIIMNEILWIPKFFLIVLFFFVFLWIADRRSPLPSIFFSWFEFYHVFMYIFKETKREKNRDANVTSRSTFLPSNPLHLCFPIRHDVANYKIYNYYKIQKLWIPFEILNGYHFINFSKFNYYQNGKSFANQKEE